MILDNELEFYKGDSTETLENFLYSYLNPNGIRYNETGNFENLFPSR